GHEGEVGKGAGVARVVSELLPDLQALFEEAASPLVPLVRDMLDAESDQGDDDAPSVVELAIKLEALRVQIDPAAEIALGAGQHARGEEGPHAVGLEGLRPLELQQGLDPPSPLRQVLPPFPEMEEAQGQAKPPLGVSFSRQPLEGRPEVVVLGLEPLAP